VTAFAGPELRGDAHVLEGFDCGTEPLTRWLTERARRNQAEGSSRTWVVTDGERVVAYYASSTAVVMRADATRRAARNQPDPLPALLLGRLAVDRKYQGCGLGAACLKHFILKSIEVSQITGVRVLLVHAKDAAAADFYLRYGFERSPVDDLTLMLLVKDLG
jgi:GNAT superfamily N-acetyltransferase